MVSLSWQSIDSQIDRAFDSLVNELSLSADKETQKVESLRALEQWGRDPSVIDSLEDDLWERLNLGEEAEAYEAAYQSRLESIPADDRLENSFHRREFWFDNALDRADAEAIRLAVRITAINEAIHGISSKLSERGLLDRIKREGLAFRPSASEMQSARAEVLKAFEQTYEPRQPARFPSANLADLVRVNQVRRPELIEGILRQGETMNVIASPKVGKTWLVAGLAFSISNGTDWLGCKCQRGRVLVFDCELHPEEIAFRYGSVGKALNLPFEGIDVVPLRGQSIDLIALKMQIESLAMEGAYTAIVFDALYRLLPTKTNENDNAAMMQLYNAIDAIAKHTGAAAIVVHHSSKGDQSGKGVTDVGAGAGSISRAADTHLTIRPHELEGCAVVEAVTRSNRSPSPLTIRFDFPVWSATHIEPELKQAKPTHQSRQDDETKKAILQVLSGPKWLSKYEIKNRTGYGESRVTRGLNMLSKDKIEIKRFRNRRTEVSSTKYKAKR